MNTDTNTRPFEHSDTAAATTENTDAARRATRGLALANTFVVTHDPEAALRFYRDVLGLTVVTDVTNEGFRWLSLGVPSQPGLEITVQTVEATCPLDESGGAGRSDREALSDLLAKGVLTPLIFAVDDVDALFERVLAHGAEVVQEPADQFYGVRDCAFRDPSGNMVRFTTPLSAD